MATALPGPLIAALRGSVGDLTFYRYPGGLGIRQRITPDETETDARKLARDAWAAVHDAWSETLTEEQRTSWRDYGRQFPHPNKWGIPRPDSGSQSFMRHNFHPTYIYTGIIFPTAPTAPPLPRPQPTITADSVTEAVTVTLPPTPFDPPPPGLLLYSYLGRPVTIGTNYYSSPWLLNFPNAYSTLWDYDPWYLLIPGGILAGQKIWLKIIAQMFPGGEISSPGIARCVAI